MTVHLISVGLSIRDALGDPYQKLGDDDLAALVEDYKPHEMLPESMDRGAASEWLTGALAAPGEPGYKAADATRLHQVSEAVRPGKWTRTISAEVETFDRVDGTQFPLSDKDIAILICSDTRLGLLAGVWNALVLTDGKLGRVRYLPEPASLLDSLRGCAVLARIAGMDAGSPEGFRDAMGGLGLLAANVFQFGQLNTGEEFRFYLSGGFKAAIPYLIGLAEAVRSIDGKRLDELGVARPTPELRPYPVKAFVLHDSAGPQAPPIELPLRRLIAATVRQEVAGYDKKSRRRAGKPGSGLLEGYAYEITGRPEKQIYELTAFGVGLRALFGVADEGLGG
jgi:hypothetical protein